jgi:hypothetical protein
MLLCEKERTRLVEIIGHNRAAGEPENLPRSSHGIQRAKAGEIEGDRRLRHATAHERVAHGGGSS